jgi:phosphoglycerate dehydrogenase-like enzyme
LTPRARPTTNSTEMRARPPVALVMVPPLVEGMIGEAQLARLRALCELLDPEPLASFQDPRADALLGRAEILLTGWGCPPLDADVLARAPKLRAVFHAAGTIRPFVTDACWERGLTITSAAAANALPVAEYALAAILFAQKRVFQLQRRYRELRSYRLWPREFPGLGNYGKCVGIVGASRIGRRVIELLRPFDLRVLLADPTVDAADAAELGVELLPLDDLLPRCDTLSLHAPSLPETRHLLDRRRLALLRDGAVLVNTARGALVDGEALEQELASGRLFAVLDTTEPELLPASSPLYDLPNVFLTPHVAGSLGGETARMLDLALDEIERFASGQPLQHAVRERDLERIA